MLSLHDAQALVTDALLGGDGRHGAAALLRDGGGVSADRRLHVYRNHLFASLGAALQAVYPVTTRLLGDDYFRHLARAYIVRHPSTSGSLHGFGAELPAFIGRQATLAALPYLADVAALEWAVHEVYHEGDEQALDTATLARVAADAQGRIRLHLQLASRFVASPFPVLAIWQANQDGAAPTAISLDDGGVHLLVARRDFEIEFRLLADAEACWLRALRAGRSLAVALQAALELDRAFDFGATLGRHLQLGTFCGCSTDGAAVTDDLAASASPEPEARR